MLRLSPCHQSHLRPPLGQTSGATGSLDLTGGEYKTRERIHRSIADLRLLAIPTSSSRVADYYPNWGTFLGLAPCHHIAAHCRYHCITCVAQGIKGHADLASSSPSSPLCIYEYESVQFTNTMKHLSLRASSKNQTLHCIYKMQAFHKHRGGSLV